MAARLAALKGNDFGAAYAEVRGKIWVTKPDGATKGYLTLFNKTNGIEFIEESVRLNLARQLASLLPDDAGTAAVYVQALLWFGPELGQPAFETLLTARVSEVRRGTEGHKSAIPAEVRKVMDTFRAVYDPKVGG